MRFEASRAIFWSLVVYKELKLTTKLFTGRTLGGLLIQMQITTFRGLRRKPNFRVNVTYFFGLFLRPP